MSELGRHHTEGPENTKEPVRPSIDERAPEPSAPERPTTDAVDRPADLRARMAADDTFTIAHIRREEPPPSGDEPAARGPNERDRGVEQQRDVEPAVPAEGAPASGRSADLQARMDKDDTFSRLAYLGGEEPPPGSDEPAAPTPQADKPAALEPRADEPAVPAPRESSEGSASAASSGTGGDPPRDVPPAGPGEGAPSSGRSPELQARMDQDDTFSRSEYVRPSAAPADGQPTETEVPTAPAEDEGEDRQITDAPTVNQHDVPQTESDLPATRSVADPTDEPAGPTEPDVSDIQPGNDAATTEDLATREADLKDQQSLISDPPTELAEHPSPDQPTAEHLDETSDVDRPEPITDDPTKAPPEVHPIQRPDSPTEPPNESKALQDTGPEQIDNSLTPDQSAKAENDEITADRGDGLPSTPTDATTPDERPAYNLDTEVEDGLTAREVVTRFDPAQANLEPLTADEAVQYIAENKDARPWLAPAADCDPAVQRIYACLDQGIGHAHHQWP